MMYKRYLIPVISILLSFAIAAYFYPQMPDKVASHWNAKGQVDGYMPKFWGVFLMPIISIFLFGLFILAPKIDPLGENVKKFRNQFDIFISLLFAFLFYIYLLTIIWNLGRTFNMAVLVAPFLAVLFYYIGILLGKAKRNWFIGIRTPWTLSSDIVWDKTHKLGGILFKLLAFVFLISVFFPEYFIMVFLIPLITAIIFLFVYSYFMYRKEKIMGR